MKRRVPRFETQSAVQDIEHSKPPNTDHTRAAYWSLPALSQRIDNTRRLAASQKLATDRTTDLLRELLLEKAIAWVLADRICDDHAATLTRIEDEVDAHLRRKYPWEDQESSETARTRALLAKLEYAKMSFQFADQRAQKRDQEFREAAKKLVDALDQRAIAPASNSKGTDP